MKIKTKLTVQFSLLVFGLFIIFSFLVYFLWETSQRSKFRDNLLRRAKNVEAFLVINGELDFRLLRRINNATISWREEEIVVTDSSSNVIYSHNKQYLTDDVIRSKIYNSKTGFFSLGRKDAVCYIPDKQSGFSYIFVSAYERARVENLARLKEVLAMSTGIGLLISIFISFLLSSNSIRPLSRFNASIRDINYQKLGNRLDEGKGKDEIEQLAVTFNEMLSNIEDAFKSQTEFISNASHELRTPIAVMITETDYVLTRAQTEEEILIQINKINNDLKSLNAKTNSLLVLANLNNKSQIQFSPLNVDEILFNSVRQTTIKYPERKIVSKVDYSDKEFIILGNSGLIEIALTNLLDNACKFSTGEVNAEVSASENIITLSVRDKGIGIPLVEIDNIMQPFRRASNAKYINGFGIGLSLVAKIISIHNATLEIASVENQGTTVKLNFTKMA